MCLSLIPDMYIAMLMFYSKPRTSCGPTYFVRIYLAKLLASLQHSHFTGWLIQSNKYDKIKQLTERNGSESISKLRTLTEERKMKLLWPRTTSDCDC